MPIKEENKMTETEKQFCELFNVLATAINDNAFKHGFYEEETTKYYKRCIGGDYDYEEVDLSNTFKAKRIALQHSELSEALEATRKVLPLNIAVMDEHCPRFTSLEIELADTVIRIMDMAKFYNLHVAEAIIAKHSFNIGRPMKHGKAF